LLTVPAIVLPLAMLLALGTRHLPFGTRWQTWTVLGLSMTLGPFLLFVLEIVLGLVGVIGAVVYIMTQPDLVAQLQEIAERILILGPQSEETIRLLSPYLTRPAVIGGLLLYIAVLVPAVEEILKPVGVWLFAGRLNSPAQGFSLGALSGAGYALIETAGVSGQQTGEWASLLFSRIGTGLLHVTTSALMGAAIVYAVRERRYARLFGTYLLAVLLHGLWNALATIFTFSTLADFLEQPDPLSTLQPTMLVSMSLLAAGLFAILLLSGQRFRRTIPPEPFEPERLPDAIEPRDSV
jgi:RsiW-degrading membrane proteinase PrsW (M82 family)